MSMNLDTAVKGMSVCCRMPCRYVGVLSDRLVRATSILLSPARVPATNTYDNCSGGFTIFLKLRPQLKQKCRVKKMTGIHMQVRKPAMKASL